MLPKAPMIATTKSAGRLGILASHMQLPHAQRDALLSVLSRLLAFLLEAGQAVFSSWACIALVEGRLS